MEDRIAHLHCRYRLIAERDTAPALARRLDRVARDDLPRALGNALDRALGGDAVYVLPRVDSRLTLRIDTDTTDQHLAQRWAQGLTAAVARTLAADGVVRFADQAEYVARFVEDLLRGRAGEHWFYFPLASYLRQSRSKALLAVLVDHREHLPRILGRLPPAVLERLLAVLERPVPSVQIGDSTSTLDTSALEASALESLWTRGLGGRAAIRPEALRPLFAAALDLADRLQLWAGSRPDAEALWRDYLAAGPTPADWRDRRGLAQAVLEALRFLARRGALRREVVGGDAGEPDIPESAVPQADLRAALDDLDWLDAGWLEKALRTPHGAPEAPPEALPTRTAGSRATPRQRELLAELAAILAEDDVRLEAERPESEANALRLYARLAARSPEWGEDPLATGVIRQLLAAWRWLARSAEPREALARLLRADLEEALRTLPATDRSRAAGLLRSLADLGEPALRITALLLGLRPEELAGKGAAHPAVPVGGPDTRPAVTPGELAAAGVDSACAGLFLLLRTLHDLRLPALLAQAAYPARDDPSTALAFLGLRWAGEAGLAGERLDPGLALFAGWQGTLELADLRDAWTADGPPDPARFQAVLLRTLAGQRLIDDQVRLYRLAGESAPILVMGTGADLWPLGAVLTASTDPAARVADWLALWEEATGRRPDHGTCDASLLADLEDRLEFSLTAVAEETSGSRPEPDELTAHRAGRRRLAEVLESVAGGRLERPDDDLTLDLAAAAVLRAWARWLGRFSGSGVPYLLTNFLHRGGRIVAEAGVLRVELDPAPLDVVLRLAGYFDDFERPGAQRVRFEIRGT